MTETTKALSGYYREIRSWLPCSRKQKDLILSRFRDSVQAYLEENPAADFDQIRAHFGTPELIAGTYVEELGTAELLRSLRVRRRIVAIVAGTALVVLLIWICAVGWAITKLNAQANGHIVDEIVIPKQTTSADGGN
jgi:hypothetical protein